MKKILCFLWISVFAVLQASSQSAKHVILISIDGFRSDFYLDNEWKAKAPNLLKLKTEGVFSKGIKSVFPSVTYPSHTTIVTGAYPASHGIYYNVPYGEKGGHWYWEESYIRVPTLWDAVKNAGLKSGAVMWPVSVGAPIDYNFPVRRADDDEKTDQLSVTRPYVTPVGLLDEMQQKTSWKLQKEDFSDDHKLDVTIGKMGSYIFKTHRPNLMAIHFLGLDHMQHIHGREGDEIEEALIQIDSMVGVVMKTVADAGLQNSTTIIITGDHGFVNSSINFSPNILLAENGLLSKENWKARFHSAGGASFLYLKDKNDKETLEKVKAILRALPSDQKKAFRMVERDELDKAGANPEVALGLALSKNYAATNIMEGEVLKKKKKVGSHGYFPDFDEIHTGFIAAGAGIGKHNEIKEMGLKDIAPLISQLLGLNFKAPDGVLIPGILVQQKK